MMMKTKSIHAQLKAMGAELDRHESDLYVKSSPGVLKILRDYEFQNNIRSFRSQTDKSGWLDIPFAFDPGVGL